jgi:4,5-DOPA dioxygenase extradiol
MKSFAENFGNTERMPVLFVGHGNPMNAIEENEFASGWRSAALGVPKPNAILCISAHWETDGTQVTAMEHPRTIHDFGGFPADLYAVQYPAPGSPALAAETKSTVTGTKVSLDEAWGLDHGCWTVVMHMYPGADVPVVQMSLDYNKTPQYHYILAKELATLRRKGVLILGSGNIVHNLGAVDWVNRDAGHEWAIEANEKVKSLILEGDHKSLIDYPALGNAVRRAVPTPEHYLPLLYALGLKEKDEPIAFFNDKTVMGSLSMTSLTIGT